MQKRAEGNKIFLEKEDGSLLLETEIQGDIAILRHGDWSMIKDMGSTPDEIIASLRPKSIRRACFRFYDVAIEIRSDIPDVLDDFKRVYSQFAEDGEETDLTIQALAGEDDPEHAFVMLMQASDRARVKGDFCAVSYFRSLEDLLFQVHAEAEVFFLTNNTRHAFIHGGAVEKDGVGYIFPAESCSGKTTLVMALVAAGYNFFSDEFAVVDTATGELLPFPRSLSVREGTLRLFPGLHERIGSFPVVEMPSDTLYTIDLEGEYTAQARSRCRVGCVVFPKYIPSESPSIRNMGAMEAFKRLVEERNYVTLGIGEKVPMVDLILSLITQARCFELITGDLKKTVSLVDGLGG